MNAETQEQTGSIDTDSEQFPIMGNFIKPVRGGHIRCREAYCLMPYADEGGRVEWLWNSRDGVTPFCLEKGLRHVQWHLDVFCPFFVPPLGMRVFVDLTYPKALTYARIQVDKYWEHDRAPMRDNALLGPMGREGAIEHLAQTMMACQREPDIVVVDEGWRALFQRRARMLNLSAT